MPDPTPDKFSRRDVLKIGERIVTGTAVAAIGAAIGHDKGVREAVGEIFNPAEHMTPVDKFGPKASSQRAEANSGAFDWGDQRIKIDDHGRKVQSPNGQIIFDGERFLPDSKIGVEGAVLSPGATLLKLAIHTEPRVNFKGIGVNPAVMLNPGRNEELWVVRRPRGPLDRKIAYLKFDPHKDLVFFGPDESVIAVQVDHSIFDNNSDFTRRLLHKDNVGSISIWQRDNFDQPGIHKGY